MRRFWDRENKTEEKRMDGGAREVNKESYKSQLIVFT